MKKLIWVIIIGFLIAAVAVSVLYSKILKSNVNLNEKEYTYIEIPSGATYNKVLAIIKAKEILVNENSFNWVAKKKEYPNLVKAGRFKIKNGMNNNELINLLRSGKQEPVHLVFNNVRTLDQLASRISVQIEADSISLLESFTNDDLISELGFDSETVKCMFIPNTYQFFWNTSSDQFVKRMHKEYKRFWNSERKQKAEKIGLSPEKVSALASIVEEETVKLDEMPVVAGVYLNRLKRGMLLQADPTVKYAIDDFTVKRILTKHLKVDSPYNTYKYRGLPPGPIRIPSITAINAVLNYSSHKYLYFCAKPDFSGYHSFARTLSEHNKNARAYRRALNKERIWR